MQDELMRTRGRGEREYFPMSKSETWLGLPGRLSCLLVGLLIGACAVVLFTGCDKVAGVAKPFGEMINWGGGPGANGMPIDVWFD